MQAVVMHETGDVDVLRCEETNLSRAWRGGGADQGPRGVSHPIDWKLRRGFVNKQLPAVLGNDVSGTVESSRADGFSEGDEVFGISASGGYAEYSILPCSSPGWRARGRSAPAPRATANSCSAWGRRTTSTTRHEPQLRAPHADSRARGRRRRAPGDRGPSPHKGPPLLVGTRSAARHHPTTGNGDGDSHRCNLLHDCSCCSTSVECHCERAGRGALLRIRLTSRRARRAVTSHSQ